MALRVPTSGSTPLSFLLNSVVLTERIASPWPGIVALAIGVLLVEYGCAASLQRDRPVLSHRSTGAVASSLSPLHTTVADDSLWYLTPQLPTVMDGFHSEPQDRSSLDPMYPADAWRGVESPNCERAKRSSDLVRAFAFCNTPR
jgi:hypothetical protein